jgi:hypothetical protein
MLGEGRSVSVMPSKQIITWAAVIAAVLLTPVDAQQGAQTPHDNVRSTTSVRSTTGVRFRRSRPNPDGPTTTRRRGTFPGTKPVNTEPATLRPATVPATARTTIRSIPDPTVATAPTVPHTATSRPVTTTAKAHHRQIYDGGVAAGTPCAGKDAAESGAYGTHMPVLHSVLNVFNVSGVLELGCGLFSTPLFANATVAGVTAVENGAEWYKSVRDKLVSSRTTVLYHYSGVALGDQVVTVTVRNKHLLDHAILFYESILTSTPTINMLFVDHYVSLRAIALLKLYEKFDLIVYHDSEDGQYKYEENFVRLADLTDFKHVSYRVTRPWTDVLVRNHLYEPVGDHFIQALRQQTRQYCGRKR